MNIAFIEPHIAVCGGIRRIIEISNRLADRGHEITWLIPQRVYDSRQFGGWMEQKFEIKPLSYGYDCVPFDVVVFNEETQYVEAKRVRAKSRVYYALHWAVLHKDYNVLRECYNGGFRLIANSNWTADAMLLETGVRPPVVNGAINPAIFHLPVAPVPQSCDILNYGASRPWKGKDIAVGIANRLGDVILRLLGDDSGIPQNELHKVYASSGCYLSTSWYEGWNWPGLEAMACGTPLVISDDGGSRDYAIHEHNALVFPAYDIEAGANNVRRVLTDPDLRTTLIENGLKTVKRFQWEQEIAHFEAILKEYSNG